MRLFNGPFTRCLLPTICIVVISGCGEDYEYREVAITHFEVLDSSQWSVQFRLTGYWPNTCGEVARFSVEVSDNSYFVTMVGRQPEDAICGAAVTAISGMWGSRVFRPGSYSFHFMQQGEASLDTTLVF